MAMIECVPNISEGRRTEVIESCAAAIAHVQGVRVLDVSADAAHNRAVLTFVGEEAPLHDAVLALFAVAVTAIDLRTHRGGHPRMGAVDVVPFVPIGDVAMSVCVALARRTARAVAGRFGIPVFLYEEAARRPQRRNLAEIRRGEFEGLVEKLARPEWTPDYGPSSPHRSAGACAIGARMPLIAFNVNLQTDRLDEAQAIARAVRQSSGGLPYVKALGVSIPGRGTVQVSMNLTNYRETPMPLVFEAVQAEATRRGVAIRNSEIIGLVPAAAVSGFTPADLKLAGFTRSQILEERLSESTLDQPSPPT